MKHVDAQLVGTEFLLSSPHVLKFAHETIEKKVAKLTVTPPWPPSHGIAAIEEPQRRGEFIVSECDEQAATVTRCESSA
jgi:hypothetical protein